MITGAIAAAAVVDGSVVDHVDDGNREIHPHGIHIGKPKCPWISNEYSLHYLDYKSHQARQKYA